MESRIALKWRTPLLVAGVGLSAFTSGTLATLSLITVPTLLSSNSTNASFLGNWKHSLQHAFKVCPRLAVLAGALHLFNAYIYRNSTTNLNSLSSHPGSYFSLAAAVSTIGIVPYTLVFMRRTNEALFKQEEVAALETTATGVEPGARELVKRWGRLNLGRALLPAVGAAIASFAL